MEIGDLAINALLSILIGAMVYLWFLSSCIIPAGSGMLEIYDNLERMNSEYEIREQTPP
jgi:hypothetical protein